MVKLKKKILILYAMVVIIGATTLVSCGKPKVENLGSEPSEIVSSPMLENEGNFLDYVNVDRAMGYINYLSENIGVRLSGSEKEEEAAKYIKEEFNKMGYVVNLEEFKYSGFRSRGKTNNVEAIKTPSGKDEADSNEIIYVTAHYDTVIDSPGANDNASGVAAMLEIANIIKDLDIDKEIRFVAFGVEEVGLKGSQEYVNKLTEEEKSRSIACFNLDMVATDYAPNVELGIYTSDGNENIVTKAIEKVGKELESLSTEFVSYNGEFDIASAYGQEMGFSGSDHASFTNAGIPAALFINIDPSINNVYEALEPYYHTSEDNISNVSIERLERSIKLVGKAIYDTVKIN